MSSKSVLTIQELQTSQGSIGRPCLKNQPIDKQTNQAIDKQTKQTINSKEAYWPTPPKDSAWHFWNFVLFCLFFVCRILANPKWISGRARFAFKSQANPARLVTFCYFHFSLYSYRQWRSFHVVSIKWDFLINLNPRTHRCPSYHPSLCFFPCSTVAFKHLIRFFWGEHTVGVRWT